MTNLLSVLTSPDVATVVGASAVLLFKLLEHEKRITRIEQKLDLLIELVKNKRKRK